MTKDTTPARVRLTAVPGSYLTQAGTIAPTARVFRADILTTDPDGWRQVNIAERPMIEDSDRAASLDARYAARLAELVHLRYSLDDEIALRSNLDDDPTDARRREYDEYLAYRRLCKTQARQEVYGT